MRRDRQQAAQLSVCRRPNRALAQGEEPRCAGGAAGARRALGRMMVRVAIITIILSSFAMLPFDANAARSKRLLKPHEPRAAHQRREPQPVTASPLSSPTNGASG